MELRKKQELRICNTGLSAKLGHLQNWAICNTGPVLVPEPSTSYWSSIDKGNTWKLREGYVVMYQNIEEAACQNMIRTIYSWISSRMFYSSLQKITTMFQNRSTYYIYRTLEKELEVSCTNLPYLRTFYLVLYSTVIFCESLQDGRL